MEFSERAKKDILKLEKLIEKIGKEGLEERYSKVIGHAKNYLEDAKFFYAQKDYFSAFGAANYAYGCLDALLILEDRYGKE